MLQAAAPWGFAVLWQELHFQGNFGISSQHSLKNCTDLCGVTPCFLVLLRTPKTQQLIPAVGGRSQSHLLCHPPTSEPCPTSEASRMDFLQLPAFESGFTELWGQPWVLGLDKP